MGGEMVVYEKPESFGGCVRLPSSKSAAHRAILCAALSGGECTVSNVDWNADVEATLRAVKALGTGHRYFAPEKSLSLFREGDVQQETVIDCGESGSTLRFVIPIFAALGSAGTFTGGGRLPQRPIGIYQDMLPLHGVQVETAGGLPFSICGRLQAGVYSLPGDISSQFITGLLYALPLLKGDSEIVLTTELESEGYVALTLHMLNAYGIQINKTEQGWHVPGNQTYAVKDMTAEGDWSHAAFFLSQAALADGTPLQLQGLNPDSLQGDKDCIRLYSEFGLEISQVGHTVTAVNKNWQQPFHGLRAISVDAAQIPDLVPAIAICAAFAKGTTVIYNAQRLHLKECDRLLVMVNAINALGGKAEMTEDGMRITGTKELQGGTAQGENDHRILMALSAAALHSTGAVRVTDAHSIHKSYPEFYNDYKKLGGIANVIHMG